MKKGSAFDVREFVPKEVFAKFGEQSKWFVSDNIVKMSAFITDFFDTYCRSKYQSVKEVNVIVNNWSTGGSFNYRALRTVDYINGEVKKGIQTAMLSQHIGGATNAIDFNVTVTTIDGKTITLDSNDVRNIILQNEKAFMDAGLTALESGHFAPTWCHADCRHTGLPHIFIVEPQK